MKRLFPLMCLFFFAGCLLEDKALLPFESFQPTDINDGWEVSTPGSENIDETTLTQIFEDVHADEDLWQLRSLLVFRNGKLVAESYLKDAEDQTSQHAIWSCTKQVLAVLVGIALEQGHIKSIGDPISDYLEEVQNGNEDKAGITLENLLTMRSGINFNETDDSSQLLQKKPKNTLQYILNIPLINEPGEVFQYNSGNSHLIAASIQNAVGKPTDEWADDVLFSQIGFSNYNWLRYDNYTFGGWGISTTPRELARVAHLVMNRGAWNGTQLVDSLWIDQMISPHILDAGSFEEDTFTGSLQFGYHWWIQPELEAYFMSGSGGQYAVIVPAKSLVVVGFSEHDTDDDLELSSDQFLGIVGRIEDAAG